MGKGSAPSIPDIRAKSLSELYTESVDTSIANLPKLYDAYAQYGPKYAQATTDIFKSQAPQVASMFNSPLMKATENFVLNRVTQATENNIPSEVLSPFRSALREAQAARGMAESPISAVTEAVQLGDLTETFRTNAFGNARDFINVDPRNAAIQALLPAPITPGALNLVPAELGTLTSINQNQENNRISTEFELAAARQEAYNKSQQKKQALMSNIGKGVGAAVAIGAAPFTAGASLAYLPAAVELGGAAGGASSTLF